MAAIFAGSRGADVEPEVTTAATAMKFAPIFAPSPQQVAPPSSKKPKPVSKPPKATAGYEMQRRALGDAVKSAISVEKWCIAARCNSFIAG